MFLNYIAQPAQLPFFHGVSVLFLYISTWTISQK